MNSDTFQRQLADVINGQANRFAANDLLGPASVEQLVQVYKNNYRVSLSEYLEAVFPAVSALVGEEFFALLAKTYIDNHPPAVPQLDGYGRSFAAHIRSMEQAESVPYLSDIAMLEWQLDRLGNQRYQQYSAFPFQQLQALDPEEQGNIRFELSQNISWQAFEYPSLGIWQGVQKGDFDGLDLDQPEAVLFHLQSDHSVEMGVISTDAITLLDCFREQKTIAEIMAQPNAANAIAQHLEAWIAQGILINFTRHTKELS